ncbi:MAG: hypothetical protein HY452_02290 [Parcubacteria group bacterium]|nr:hypothetical protein [Parcubacteria group bacterium]
MSGRSRFSAAESIFKISGNKLDKKYLKIWADRLGISKLLAKLILLSRKR